MVDDLGSFPRPVLGALAAAERLLSRRTGATIVLADPEDLGGSDRSVVARARVARNPFSLPRTLVVKHYRDEPAPGRPDPFPFEVASAQLFTSMSPELRPSPVLIAHDPASRLLVMEDLGRSSTLADKLFGPDGAAAQRCLLSWAGALGRMQAATAGREKDFGALLRRLGERAWRDPMADEARAAFAGVAGLLRDELGVVATPAAVQEAHDTARLLGGTRYRAFSPSDTCPTTTSSPAAACASSTSSGAASATSRSTPPTSGCPSRAARRASRCRRGWPTRCSPPGATRSPPCGRTSRSPDAWTPASSTRSCCGCGCARGGVLPRIRVRDQHVGQDAARSPRISTALSHYWDQLAADAAVAGKSATAELGVAVAEALNKRFPDAPAALPVYPAFRTAA